MEKICGKPVGQGIGLGRLLCLKDVIILRKRSISPAEAQEEHQRLETAIKEANREIDDTLKLLELEKKEEDILITHKMILQDPEMLGNIREIITSELICLEQALMKNLENIKQVFAGMKNDYFAERYLDYKDVTQRMIRQLTDYKKPNESWHDRILVAQEFTPSQVVEAYRQQASGIISIKGNGKSHTAILARSLMIPFVTDIKKNSEDLCDQNFAIIDGFKGDIYIEPDELLWKHYSQEKKNNDLIHQELVELAKKETVTLDGQKIKIYCNIEIPEEIEVLKKMNTDGIGLFRTEFLYLDRDNPPSEEEQFKIYREVAEKLAPLPVIIRTMDIGGDKVAPYFHEQESNPNLGLRGIRMSFHREEIFKEQIRALLRAAAFGNIKVMFPMISCVAEVRKAREIMGICAAELKQEGLDFKADIPIGSMIEVPSAAIRADKIAPECDFFSIGTNDLVQYTMAVDRNSSLVNEYYNELDTAVLTLIRNVCNAAHAAGIKVAVCGEMASQAKYTELLLGLGIDELSTSPAQFGLVKKTILTTDSAKGKAFADSLLS
ncbi:MAG: phosphoenolpyruvate--protein phosphotransferase [Candidatus Cloacimonetes bacterium]|nr:phosphoenolpyruvate--protein phosphotransferase [Candidatus Cloacimonadota bacterium]